MNDIRFFKFEIKDYPYHFWIIQFVVFSYIIYRLISRDYSVYGLVPEEYFNYPRAYTNVYPNWIVQIFNTHWIYWFLDYPNNNTLKFLQNSGIIISAMGLIGIFPRICALISFILLTHLTGFIQATNAEIEGGTLLLVSLLVLTVSIPSQSFFRLGLRRTYLKSNDYRWPVFLLFLFVGTFLHNCRAK